VLFAFPSRYWFTIGQKRVFSLTGWSPWIQAGFLVPRLTQVPASSLDQFRLRVCHPLWSSFPEALTIDQIGNSTGLGCSDFARHYYRNRGFFIFLEVLRWFTSLRSPAPTYVFSRAYLGFAQVGFPIRKSPDQRLCAAPRSLSQLATSFIACFCQGIHRAPLVA
jgi:hypothetical protein